MVGILGGFKTMRDSASIFVVFMILINIASLVGSFLALKSDKLNENWKQLVVIAVVVLAAISVLLATILIIEKLHMVDSYLGEWWTDKHNL